MKQKVLFVSHDLVMGGGGALVAGWMLEALVSAYEVTTLTWEPPEYAALDRKFGTSLAGRALETLIPSAVERWLVERIPTIAVTNRPTICSVRRSGAVTHSRP